MKRIIPFIFILLIIFAFACQKQESRPQGRTHADWTTNNTIYELNIRQFSNSGTFNAVYHRLIAIKELGVKTIWLMPIHPIGEKNRKGTLGSYYSIKDYRAVNPEFGTMEDFKRLVDKIHEMGMYVIIDWVANHTTWDNPLVEEHPDWYTHDSTGQIIAPVPDWTDVADLNYDNPEVWDYMIASMKFWITETNIDGFRCDVAEMVPLGFWNRARKELDAIKPVFMLAEGAKPELHDQAFDATYSWELFHLMNEIAQGKKTALSIDTLLAKEEKTYPASAMIMRFTSNHDENSWNGTVFERLGDGAQTFAVLTATLPGVPLLYSGQEAGLDKRLNFFEKDPIEWHVNYFRRFYSRLFGLHKKNPALFAGSMEKLATKDDAYVYAFIRTYKKHKVVTVLNFSAEEKQVELNDFDLSGDYREYFSFRKVSWGHSAHITLEPWDYQVYVLLDK